MQPSLPHRKSIYRADQGGDFIKLSGGDPLCTLHRAEGLCTAGLDVCTVEVLYAYALSFTWPLMRPRRSWPPAQRTSWLGRQWR